MIEDQMNEMKEMYDIIIVGGGVTGLYTGYKLSIKFPEKNILILEKEKRCGGKILTINYKNIKLELGPMRFEQNLQPLLFNMIEDLGIKYSKFSPYTCPYECELSELKLRDDEYAAIKHYSNQCKSNHKSIIFTLLKYGIKLLLGNQWDVDNDNVYADGRDNKKEDLKKNGEYKGIKLHNIGFWNALSMVLSTNAINHINHYGSFYHVIGLNANAADHITFMLDILATSKDELITINGGVEQIITKLLQKIDEADNININKNIRVDSYDDTIGIITNVKCGNNQILKCQDLIFTCHKNAYKNIQGFPQYIQENFQSVMVVDLFKLFIVISNPPFNEKSIPMSNTNAHKIPCRELHYDYDTYTKNGIIMLYGDNPSVNFWASFLKGNGYICNDSPELEIYLGIVLDKLFPLSKIKIEFYSLLKWSNSPYSTGIHLWRPGYVSSDIMNKFVKFGKHNKIHICGEAYSTYQGFIEGCLRSANLVIKSIQ